MLSSISDLLVKATNFHWVEARFDVSCH